MRCHRSSISGYNRGCRCEGCVEASRAGARRRQRARRRRLRIAAGASHWCVICDEPFISEFAAYCHEIHAHIKAAA